MPIVPKPFAYTRRIEMNNVNKIVGAVVLGLAFAGAIAPGVLQGPAEAAAMAQQGQETWPRHFVYDFEAYDHGRFVQSMHWETDALSEQHLLQLMAGAQAGFAQRLNDARIPWNAIHPIFRSSQPIPR
jgi:hypothetical protein